MEFIPTSVCLTSYAGGPEEFMNTPMAELVEQVEKGQLNVVLGKVYSLDQIVEAHECMEVRAGLFVCSGRIVGLY